MKINKKIFFIGFMSIFALTGCNKNEDNNKLANESNQANTKIITLDPLAQKVLSFGIKAIPADEEELKKLIENSKNPITEAKVELGKKLYFDPRLSKSELISCNTCHNLATGGVDGVEAAIGDGWKANPHNLNSPTVYNSVFNKVQFWDGRSPHLEDQAQGPIQAVPEMAASKELVVQRVTSIPEYVEEFKKAYGNDVKITFELVADTIALFERTLVTPSRFDDFLNGDSKALSDEEKEGLTLFVDKGCINCHTGIGIGGGMQVFDARGVYQYKNVGDFVGDKMKMVKVPTLRNISETAPYFHNGQIWTLKEAIQTMGKVQLNTAINDADVAKIEIFLKSLTGRKPEIKYPMLPASTENTPKPIIN
ncbi:MAG: cytochrome-c peroxidase [Sulfurovaceae bacterium]|nr:cytochrome-c peroxidase [Sulfurovaceae bacterium]MDD5549290.1 cytochrome-c peroxidase [Sulfurovaceae bacterium]